DEGTDEGTGDSETLYIMAFFPGEGVLDDYSLVLANCVMSEQSMTPESCEEGVYSVVLSSIVMDGNSTSQPGVMFMDTDASETLSSGDMIIIDHSQLNLTEEWNTPRLHSAEANAYADENPMMPGFTGILATLGLLGAALSRRE
ncbi:MAG: PGF-CTERM sorting domain-containing protein, partial [Candidatus Poseidoniaceae archaeon]